MAFSSKTDVNSSIDLSDGYDRLAQSLIDIIKEQQAKLGYRKEIVRLYYPLSSLNHFFEGHLDSTGMLDILKFKVTIILRQKSVIYHMTAFVMKTVIISVLRII